MEDVTVAVPMMDENVGMGTASVGKECFGSVAPLLEVAAWSRPMNQRRDATMMRPLPSVLLPGERA
jgi:hypothetical protein